MVSAYSPVMIASHCRRTDPAGHPGWPTAQGLYDPAAEHDACGVGFLADILGRPSHSLVSRSVEVLCNLMHRGAVGGDRTTGDGAGILFQIPTDFYRSVCKRQGIVLPEGPFGVGMFFLPDAQTALARCRGHIETALAETGLSCLGWREVPTNPSVLGDLARSQCPRVMQVFVSGASGSSSAVLEDQVYLARKRIQHLIDASRHLDGASAYVVSLSALTVVYKGMLMGDQVARFYPDLQDPRFVSSLSIMHQRYSTNTFPSWSLAQPFRCLAHNGEINTLRGNCNQMRARERSMQAPCFGDRIDWLLPVIEPGSSDSGALDNTFELLLRGGRSAAHAMSMLIPQAWGETYPIGPDLRGFFEYHAGLMEPWDGPATVAFSDGRRVGALLDRNGLRPARYVVTEDDFVVLASEAGVLDFPPETIRERGALRPGQIFLVDPDAGRVRKDAEIKRCLARRQPYRRWVEENKVTIQGFSGAATPVTPDSGTLLARQRLFGYTQEDLTTVLAPMAAGGHEPIGSMGLDVPLAVMSAQPQLVFHFFKQLFAQVTNPAIDPIREKLVMSLMTFIGNPANILAETPQHAKLIKLQHPVLSNEDLHRIRGLDLDGFKCATLTMGFPAGGGGDCLASALASLAGQAVARVSAGETLVVLSDRDLPTGQTPIPSLLALAAVHGALLQAGLRTGAGLLVETGEARETMHIALLLGYGATAVNPYLAFETVAQLALDQELEPPVGVARALERYIEALGEGLRKIMSKMGIATLRSYRGAQVFEAIGLAPDLVERYFPGTVSRIGGIGLDAIAAEANRRRDRALQPKPGTMALLERSGVYRLQRDGEAHLWSPASIKALQQACRTGDSEAFSRYADLIDNQAHQCFTLRGLFRFLPVESVPLAEVEPASEIVKRFVTGAMSFGSISREAHETLAIAMNRLGAKSNSGEGGEDPARYIPRPNGDSLCSAVKQIASGRFGVTAEYCVNCRELQIKIAQGAKPGEGGQLPGRKVNAEIARVRHATPGVTLISPPPHHDIYSIEDLKQLIFDLRSVNPQARISIKLASESGVGTVAAGVVKADADAVLISGHDGGTGAAPLSSIRHAGAPWELGLAETHQTLLLNGLRGRVRLQVDGQLKSGRDVVIAALLGAEEFGFATAALIAEGCVMMRRCHNNTCPVGVATQDPALRKRFRGTPEAVVRFMLWVAEDTRRRMADLGFRTVDDMVGRSDRLAMHEALSFWKTSGLDLSALLQRPAAAHGRTATLPPMPQPDPVPAGAGRPVTPSDLNRQIRIDADAALERAQPVRRQYAIRNVNRTIGTFLAGEIARRYGHAGLPDGTIGLTFRGTAGQSFGAWCTRGMTLLLEGEANDYLGKGLSGGRIVVKPAPGSTIDPDLNVLAGNVLLYGATCGEVYIAGRAGERFAIRNSGAQAVVEGLGDHGCEYMTGGRVVVLGQTGVNFAAGMSGGIAYVYDADGLFDTRCNLEMVDLDLVEPGEDETELRQLIERHLSLTGSLRAGELLNHWAEVLPFFVKVFPMEYRLALGRMRNDDAAVARRAFPDG